MSTEPTTCPTCGEPWEPVSISLMGVTITTQRCDQCTDAAWALQQSRFVAEAKPKATTFADLAAAAGFRRYLDFDAEQLPNPSAFFACLDAAKAGRGSLLIGETSQGKTYCGVEILRLKHLVEGAKVRLVDCVSFGLAVGQIDSERREAEIQAAIKADWLLMDDLGKVAVTPRVAEALFHVAKMREDSDRPTIWTMNGGSSSELHRKMPSEIAEPFLQRVRRTCEVVPF
jgi:DNA replication protein DnaC